VRQPSSPTAMEGFLMVACPLSRSKPDFLITFHGTIATLDLLSNPAGEWVNENLQTEHWQWLGKSCIGIDPRSAEVLRQALAEAGLADAEER
jgi:hypothetical protein